METKIAAATGYLMVLDSEARRAALYDVVDTTQPTRLWQPKGSPRKVLDNLTDEQLSKMLTLWEQDGKLTRTDIKL